MALDTMSIGPIHASLGTNDEGLAHLQSLIQALAGAAEENGRAAAAQEVSTAVSAQIQGNIANLSFFAGDYYDSLDAAQPAVYAALATSEDGPLSRQLTSP